MIKTNKDKLVIQSVQGKIHHPLGGNYRISHEGEPRILPATGGITYNVHVGDPAFGWECDHVEPSVSIRNEDKAENDAIMNLACPGNIAKVVSGDAKGAVGYVLGGHGGIEHTIIEFHDEDMEKMAVDDKILIKAHGQGLKLIDYPEIIMTGIDPEIFSKIKIDERNGKLHFPVVCKIPAVLMGSGIGSSKGHSGDYDIMTQDKDLIKKLGIDKLRFGDFVLLEDCDNTFGRGYLKGAVTIGIVIHSDCIKAGHGPGITTFMSCKKPLIEAKIQNDANIRKYIDL
ncbi:DUF4438 domain-containing protein [Paramaledivibacter caminithermalis]|jgi:hypothetical protein|uniref:DUF4438 domain-containing protein n=1 Tax=Paramaledivibacter caminithermalis (strain DSM 15212 / CIP 107654 / DViRD3) TaxID=1121301 RepID=A0A1M6SUH3_PARC5|nr:DUF4438 domain-containing protein [Paramaledivibacter caminithermalis]SHK48218.1 protein of unknown function [Paramaledivibacter caminithermalis DSM 15212]